MIEIQLCIHFKQKQIKMNRRYSIQKQERKDTPKENYTILSRTKMSMTVNNGIQHVTTTDKIYKLKVLNRISLGYFFFTTLNSNFRIYIIKILSTINLRRVILCTIKI